MSVGQALPDWTKTVARLLSHETMQSDDNSNRRTAASIASMRAHSRIRSRSGTASKNARFRASEPDVDTPQRVSAG